MTAPAYAIPGAAHRFVDTNGITLSVYDTDAVSAPSGGTPPLLLLHGFPDLAYAWRHQIPVLAEAGYRCVAPDQRGYGLSTAPAGVPDYDIHHLTADLTGLLDALGLDRALVVGHDWGGIVGWQMPLLHPDRVAGVVGVNTPLLARPSVAPTQLFRALFGADHYIVRFQEPDEPDRLLAANVDTFLAALARTGVPPAEAATHSPLHFGADPGGADRDGARHDGADRNGARSDGADRGDPRPAGTESGGEESGPAELPGRPLMTGEEMSVYVETFRATGFTGGINWYRNMDRNWETTEHLDGARVDGIPCLMITAEWDPYLPPALAAGMVDLVSDLETHNFAACGHWTQQEKPDELNAVLLDWLGRRFPPSPP